MVYQTEKSLTEYGDKISDDDKNTINAAIADLKKVLEDPNADAAAIKAKTEELQKASYKLAEEMYKNTAQAQQGAQDNASSANNNTDKGTAEDADYEVVDDDK